MRKVSVGWVVCLTVLAALVMVLPLPEAANIPCPTATSGQTCQGVPATCVGTSEADTITETTPHTNNVIVSGKGVDTINLGNGNNTICAGWGNDVIDLGNGNNFIYGGWGEDDITVGGGNNWIEGGQDNDNIDAGAGANQIFGGQDNDTIVAVGGTIDGGPGEDTCSGGAVEVGCELNPGP